MYKAQEARLVATHDVPTEHPDFAYKKRVITQILSDWHLPYTEDEPGWPLNRHVFDNWGKGDLATSKRIVYKIVETDPRYVHLSVFFQRDTFGYADLAHLAEKAARFPVSDSARAQHAITRALDSLTIQLWNIDLFCTFPDASVTTQRRETTEEGYLRYADRYDKNLETLQKTYKHAKLKALELTAREMEVSVPTVKRALKWRREHPNHGQKHRTPKPRANRRSH